MNILYPSPTGSHITLPRAICIGLSLLFISLAACTASASNWYVAQSSQGANTGKDAADALSIAWLNNPANWRTGTNAVNPGDTVHLCGTITTSGSTSTGYTLTIYGSGTVGNVITIYFEPNAKLSESAYGLINGYGQDYIVIDGGSNGVLENTDNGTALRFKKSISEIYDNGCSNMEIKNLTVQNLYLHVSGTDGTLDFSTNAGIYMNGFGNNISIDDCTFHDICFCMQLTGASGASGLSVYKILSIITIGASVGLEETWLHPQTLTFTTTTLARRRIGILLQTATTMMESFRILILLGSYRE